MKRVEIFYDIVCPFAYLGSTQIDRVASEAGAVVEWKPFLLGGVFRAIGTADNAMESMSAAKLRHNALDMHRWAEHFGVPLRVPSEHPRRTVLALRAVLAAGRTGGEVDADKRRIAATHALFRAYWVDGIDVADAAAVAAALEGAGLDGGRCVELAADPAIKQELRERTDEAVSRGVFGAPTFFVGEAMYWGQDRLDFVARALARAA